MHADTNSRLLFQKQSRSVQDKWPKVRIVLVIKSTKRVLASLDATPGAISQEFFLMSVHRDPSLIFRVSSRSIQISGRY